MSVVNAAVKASLERVFAEERRNTALRMAQIRVVLAIAAFSVGFLPMRRDGFDPRPTQIGTTIYLFVAFGLLALAMSNTRWGRWSTLAVALVDIPAVSLIQAVQADKLGAPWMGIPTAIALPCAFVGLSTLSLSRSTIGLTALVAMLSILRRLLTFDLGIPPIVLTLFVPGALGLVGMTVVGKVRSLVHAARKRDLVGRYVLGERLGAGGMAEVFAATYSPEGGFERRVAVKRILPSFADRPESIALFRREAELGAGLAHPNVVQVLDFGADGDAWFIAMEYVDGVPLSRILSFAKSSFQPLPLPVCVFVIEQVALALDYIHTRTTATGAPLKMVHRDVNPPNVLISAAGDVKLTDFGVARASGSNQLTEAGVLRGKVGYTAPEQLHSQTYDNRLDLWALGVTAFELLILARPFSGPDAPSIHRATLEAPVPSLRAQRSDLPKPLEEIVRALLERDPEQRTRSAAEVAVRLAALGPEFFDREAGRAGLVRLLKETRAQLPASATSFLATPTVSEVVTLQARHEKPQ